MDSADNKQTKSGMELLAPFLVCSAISKDSTNNLTKILKPLWERFFIVAIDAKGE